MCTTSTTIALKLKKVVSKLLTKETKHVGRKSRGHANPSRKGTQGMLTHEHVSSQATLTRGDISTQDMLTFEHDRT